MQVTREGEVLSPLQVDIRAKGHPVREEIGRMVGSYQLVVTVEEDLSTIDTLSHIPGLVAFIATIRRGSPDGVIISQGRGSVVINRLNRMIERAVSACFNASVSDAVKTMKSLNGLLDPRFAEVPLGAERGPEGATDRQKRYLRELIQTHIADQRERDRLCMEMEVFTKQEASAAIQSFVS
ncbi:MAG: hypothetical protein V4674_00445 [Patescibacteria group bacterium]